jgi:hypothetical protein
MAGNAGAEMNPNPMNQQFEMLMNQLMQTSNAAIRAAEAANALMTSSSTSTSSSGNGSSKELYKLISNFSFCARKQRTRDQSVERLVLEHSSIFSSC